MLNEPSHDRKPELVLIDADFSNDSLLCNDILNKFEETISKESNIDVIPNIICPQNASYSCGKRVQCEAQVLNEFEFDYNSDDFISTAVYPYHEFNPNVYSSQYLNTVYTNRFLDKEGRPITEIHEQWNRWVESFKELLNRSATLTPPDIEAAHTDLPIDVNPPTTEEITMAVRRTKSGKAAGPNNIPAEALKSK
ncbi:unnamed protein product [Schistosoma mattheei]|uniref:Uncharacterized protein n=1 Tax=Schistosoma mattheei TaxID=31246 RepID=A0A183P0G9_9TREM|nr:unnamed protein product [Schistosoma mattheei]